MKIPTNVASGGITTTTFQPVLWGGANSFISWGAPIFIEAREVGKTIEFIYKQVSNTTLTIYPSPPPEERIFKIIFSCKKGKWHKSEPIYGKIIPAQEEYYDFEQ